MNELQNARIKDGTLKTDDARDCYLDNLALVRARSKKVGHNLVRRKTVYFLQRGENLRIDFHHV